MQVYWLEQAAADVPSQNEWLSERELVHLGKLRFAKRRADWRLGRWTAKRAVGAALGVPDDPGVLRRLVIVTAATGEPIVEIEEDQPVTISISHRDGLAACAVALGNIALGCDLELIEPKSDAFVADYFTLEEQALVRNAALSAQPLVASLLWSAKESALKALHVGLRADVRSVAVDSPDLKRLDASGIDWRPLMVRCTGGPDFHGWWRCTGNSLSTVVAAPAPLRPISLDVSEISVAPGLDNRASQSLD